MSIKKYIKEFSFGLNTMFKEFFNKETNKKQRANMWTFLRLITPFFALITSFYGFSIMSGIIVGFGGLTDFFDGRSARKYNATSEFGKRLDQVADKVFVFLSGIAASIINPIFIPIILMEGAIASVNIYYKKKYPMINDKSALVGKIKQFPLFLSIFINFLSKINTYLKIITDILVLTTILMQSATFIYYSKTKYLESKKIDKYNIHNQNNINEYIKEQRKENIKTLKQLKTTNNSKNISKQKIKKKDRY